MGKCSHLSSQVPASTKSDSYCIVYWPLLLLFKRIDETNFPSAAGQSVFIVIQDSDIQEELVGILVQTPR